MPQRSYGGSQPSLACAPQNHYKWASPGKPQPSAKLHHGLMSSSFSTNQNPPVLSNQQQLPGKAPPVAVQQALLVAGASQASLYGGPVQVNGRQMQTLHQGMLPESFSQMVSTTPPFGNSQQHAQARSLVAS